MDSSVIKKLILFFFIIFNTSANSIEFKGDFFQGHFVLGKTNSGAEILIDNKKINVSEDGYFVFGIDRDRKYDLVITEIFNGKKNKITKKILKRDYNIQRIDGLPESKVTPLNRFIKELKKKIIK